jgi:alginate O-acetyltransferase complex protein AlgI
LFDFAVYLVYFLPIVLIGTFVIPPRWRNAWLLLASVVFFGWVQPLALVGLVAMVLGNYLLGRWLDRARDYPVRAGRILAVGVAANIIPLVVLKLCAAYIVPGLLSNQVLDRIYSPAPVHVIAQLLLAFLHETGNGLPLGFSFLVFQAVAYLVDVYKRRTASEASWSVFAVYLAMFPKVTAGPIVLYRDIRQQLSERPLQVTDVARGARRFVVGLGKKVLVADMLGPAADRIFSLPAANLTTGLAWLGAIVYAMQIYYDFSGYSDMAIGVAQMLGFKFPENFNYPYIAGSISEFWRRWHMTLSGWFRYYVFYPLERQNKHRTQGRLILNILLVFFVTGFWHGAALNYVAWGLWHGAAIALEQTRPGVWLTTRAWRPLRHVYALAVVLSGWVLFRSSTLEAASGYFRALIGVSPATSASYAATIPLSTYAWLSLVLGAVCATPIVSRLTAIGQARFKIGAGPAAAATVGDLWLLAVLVASLLMTVASTYQAYIYMRF